MMKLVSYRLDHPLLYDDHWKYYLLGLFDHSQWLVFARCFVAPLFANSCQNAGKFCNGKLICYEISVVRRVWVIAGQRMQEDFKQALKEYLQPVQPTVQTNFSSHNESTILANLYTQSKQRFYLGIGGLFFFAFLVFLEVILAIVIFASAPHETGENKVLQ